MEKLVYDNSKQVKTKVDKLRKAFGTHKTKDLDYRIKQLNLLKAAVTKYTPQIEEANKKDLGQSKFLSFFATTSHFFLEVDHMISHLKEWAAPRSVDTPVAFAPASSYIVAEPLGVVLVFGAWNFNVSLSLIPMATAIAAGNVVLLKPSEMASNSALVIEKICSELDSDLVQVCQGAQETCEALLLNRFDLIFLTGSPMKGKIVAKAAAEFLTPCILELGGQNPCIVDKNANITNAALNLCSGRFFGCGQVCLSPEYVFVEESMKDALVEELKKTVEHFYSGKPKESEDFARIINTFHAERLSKLCTNHGGKLICGGDFDIKEKYVAPTIVEFKNLDELAKSPLQKDEIFGPILSVVPYKDLDDCIDYINGKEKPLAM